MDTLRLTNMEVNNGPLDVYIYIYIYCVYIVHVPLQHQHPTKEGPHDLQ